MFLRGNKDFRNCIRISNAGQPKVITRRQGLGKKNRQAKGRRRQFLSDWKHSLKNSVKAGSKVLRFS